jgi:16S rRNA (guanine527-N7)-methyltransferase
MNSPAGLMPLLEQGKELGFLGPGPVERHVEHSLGFVEILASLPADVVDKPLVDLGSGGGIPGLVIASLRRPSRTVLLDGSTRRAAWLTEALECLGLTDSVTVVGERAEVAGRSPALRHRCGVVVARLFGRPAVTAECAAPFLGPGGTLVVSEPGLISSRGMADDSRRPRLGSSTSPVVVTEASLSETDRWPAPGLAELGLGQPRVQSARGFAFATILRVSPCSDRYPRRTGIPTKRPLF